MILHVVAAVFVEQAGQDPLWARLAFAAIPSVFALGIAWLVFRLHRGWDRKRWVLDQKKAEWKEILVKVAAIEETIPCITAGSPDYESLNDSVVAVLPLLRGSIFVYGALESRGLIGKWESYAGFASGIVETIKGDDTVQGDPPELLNPGDKEGSRQSRKAYERSVRMKLHEFREELRTLARTELEI